MVCYTGCTFFDVPQLINLKQKEEVDARGGKPLNSSNKIHLVEMDLVPVAFETQHTVPRLMGGFANADAAIGYWTVATTQRLKHPSYMSKTTYLSFI